MQGCTHNLQNSGLFTVAKKFRGDLLFQSLPWQHLGIIYCEVNGIFMLRPSTFSLAASQIKVKYSHCENFSVKQVQELLAIKYYFYRMRSCYVDVLFIVLGYLRLGLTDIIKRFFKRI